MSEGRDEVSADQSLGLPPGSVGGIAYDALTMAREANDKAERALRDIEGHEDICAERYRNINEKLGMLFKIIAWAGGTGFLLIMGLLAFLAKTQFESINALQKAAVVQRADPLPPQVIIQRAPGQGDMGATVERQQH